MRLERMAREKEADRVELALQAIADAPGLRLHLQRRLARLGEQSALTRLPVFRLAIGQREHRLDAGEGDGAVGLHFVEGAGAGQTFQRFLVDLPRIDAAGEIRQRLEGRIVTRLDDRLRLRRAHALDRAERIKDRRLGLRVVAHAEIGAGLIDRRRRDAQSQSLRIGAEFGELVGVAHVERHRGGEELGGMIGLQISGLVGQQRIRRGVRFVEAIFGEFGASVENAVGQRLRQARPRRRR